MIGAPGGLAARRAPSFDYLVGAGEQQCRHGETEYPGSLLVDDQLELARPSRAAASQTRQRAPIVERSVDCPRSSRRNVGPQYHDQDQQN